MPDFIKGFLDRVKNWWGNTDKKDRLRFIVVAGLSLVVLIVAVSLLARKEYAVLYGGMDAADAGQMAAILTEKQIDYKTEGTGTILVPADQVSKLTMELAAEGYPKSGFTYETFGKGTGFGATDFDKKMYAKFDLQERIQSSLMSMDTVKGATVELAQQDNADVIFVTESYPTTASVTLELKPDTKLTPEQVDAVEYLVASSVPGLKTENVFITDQYLNRLNRKDQSEFSTVAGNLEMERMVRDDMVRSVTALLSPIFGVDNVKVSGQAQLDFDEHTTESVVFAPVVGDKGIEASLRRVVEKATGQVSTGEQPGTGTNGGGNTATEGSTGGAPTYPLANQDLSNYSNVVDEINYEVNQTLDKVNHAKGTIRDLSLSVAVNSDKFTDENSLRDAVRNLVAGAVGLKEEDYSRISVQMLKFDGLAQTKKLKEDMKAEEDAKNVRDLIRDLVLYLLISACVILIIVRFFALFKKEVPVTKEEEEAALGKIGEVADADEAQNLLNLATQPEEPMELGTEITVTKSPTRERVEEFISKNPEAVSNLLRNWLTEEQKGSRKR